MQYSARVEQTALATTIARSRLADVRRWAGRALAGAYNFDNLSGYPEQGPASDPEHPEFTVAVTFSGYTLYSPCTTFQSVQSDDNLRRKLLSSCQRVEVRVNWMAAGMPSEVKLVSLLADPPRQLQGLVVTGGAGGPLAPDASTAFSAQGTDENGQAIPDLFFKWTVRPKDGVGRVDSVSADTVTCQFKNLSYRRDGSPQHTGGFCGVAARARYRGLLKSTTSSLVELTP